MDGAMDKLNDAYDNLMDLQRVHTHLWEAYKVLGNAEDDFDEPSLRERVEWCVNRTIELMHLELDKAGSAIGAMMDEQSERTAAELRKVFGEAE